MSYIVLIVFISSLQPYCHGKLDIETVGNDTSKGNLHFFMVTKYYRYERFLYKNF